jgi:lauroyl/myristoyl acyltransferase
VIIVNGVKMLRPETIFNNALLRALVQNMELAGARRVIHSVLLPLLLPPWKVRKLRKRVEGHFRAYFPQFTESEITHRGKAFVDHYLNKFAEDSITINLQAERMNKWMQQYVVFSQIENFHTALEQFWKDQRGMLLGSAHLGSPSFCLNALAQLCFSMPRKPKARICLEPDVLAYPQVIERFRNLVRSFDFDVDFLTTDRNKKDVASDIAAILNEGGAVTTNMDVMQGGKSDIPLPIFGCAKAKFPAIVGLAKMALRTGCLILPWFSYRTTEGFVIRFEPHISTDPLPQSSISQDHPEVLALSLQLCKIMESWICSYPEQWIYWDRFYHRLIKNPNP